MKGLLIATTALLFSAGMALAQSTTTGNGQNDTISPMQDSGATGATQNFSGSSKGPGTDSTTTNATGNMDQKCAPGQQTSSATAAGQSGNQGSAGAGQQKTTAQGC